MGFEKNIAKIEKKKEFLKIIVTFLGGKSQAREPTFMNEGSIY